MQLRQPSKYRMVREELREGSDRGFPHFLLRRIYLHLHRNRLVGRAQPAHQLLLSLGQLIRRVTDAAEAATAYALEPVWIFVCVLHGDLSSTSLFLIRHHPAA